MSETSGPVQVDANAPALAAPAASRIDRWTKWLTLIANLGVLVGVILVILEMRQNADLTRVAMEQRKNDLLAQIELSIAQPEMAALWVKSIRTPEALTDAESRMVESHLVALMLQWDHMLQMEANGLITRDHARQHILSSAPFYFGSRFGKNWWKYEEDGWKGTRMFEIAGPVINGLDENFIAKRLDLTRIPPPVATP